MHTTGKFLSDVKEEYKKVCKKYSKVNSLHEGYGLLAEEVAEFFDEVRKKEKDRKSEEVRQELIQIVSICMRINDILK